MVFWRRPHHTTSPVSPPTSNTSTTHPEDNHGTYRSAPKPALGTRVTKRKDSYPRFTHREWKEQEYYGRDDTPVHFQDNDMSKGRSNEASGQASGPSTPQTVQLEEGFVTCREPGDEGCGSRDDIQHIGPRKAKFAEDFDRAPEEYFEHLKGTPAKEGLSEGSLGGTGREAAGEVRVGNDRNENDHVGDDHAGFQDVPLGNATGHPEVSPPTSPRPPVGRTLSAQYGVSSIHEGGPSLWERPSARRQATEPTVREPTSPRSTEHIEPTPEPTHFESIDHHPSPASSPGTPRTRRNPKSFRSKVSTHIIHPIQPLWSYTVHKFRTHPIITLIAILLLLLGIILFSYLLARFIPWVIQLLKLKSYIDSKLAKIDEWKGKFDQFKDQVAGKFRDWLGDGKSLADNVKEKIKEKVTGATDHITDWIPKTRLKGRYVDRRGVIGPAGVVGIAGRAFARRGFIGNVGSLFGAVSGGKAETVAVTSEVVMATATSWEPSSIWRSSAVVEATETNGAVARRGNIPLPFVLLGGLAGLVRGEDRIPKVSDRIGTTVLESQAIPTPATTPTSTEDTPTSTSTLGIQNAGLQVREPGGGRGGGSSNKSGNQNNDKTPEPEHSDNHTSSALGHRNYLPYPILILGNMLRYARAEIVNPMEKFPPASTAARSSTTGVASALRPREVTFFDCLKMHSQQEFQHCCNQIEDPYGLDQCRIHERMDPHGKFPVTTIHPVKRFANGGADYPERTQESEVHSKTGTISLASTTTVIHEVTKSGESSGIGASRGAKSVLGESVLSSTVFTTSTAVASTDEELIEPTSTETANLAVRRFGGLSWW